jgi:hypothetical protein
LTILSVKQRFLLTDQEATSPQRHLLLGRLVVLERLVISVLVGLELQEAIKVVLHLLLILMVLVAVVVDNPSLGVLLKTVLLVLMES